MAVAVAASNWAFASGLVAARELRLHPAAFFRQVAAEEAPEAALRHMSETPLGDRVRTMADLHNIAVHSAAAWREALDEMRSFCPSDAVLELLRLHEDFVSLKNYLKRRELARDAQDVLPPRYGESVWERLWTGLAVDLPEEFSRAAEQAHEALRAQPDDPEALDAAVDSVCLSALVERAARCGSSFILDHYERYDTAKGVEMLWRARAAAAPGPVQDMICRGRRRTALFRALTRADETAWMEVVTSAVQGPDLRPLAGMQGAARIRAFVRAADERLMAELRQARLRPFGPERVFGYMLGLEAELHNLKVAAGGRARGVSPQLLEGRWRACYAG